MTLDDRIAAAALRLDLILAAVEKHRFTEPPPTDAAAVDGWFRRLVAHVEQRDWADAFEILIGRRRADWTADDCAAFVARRAASPGPRLEFGADDVRQLSGVMDSARYACTTATLKRLARRGLGALAHMRRDEPRAEFPVFVSLLMADGRLMSLRCNSDDRVAVVKHFARHEPLFAYFVVFDAYSYVVNVDPAAPRTEQRDALMCQAGSRDTRWLFRRLYRVEGDRVIFDAPTPEELDLTGDDLKNIRDPWAEIFVSVPPSTAPPS